MAVCMSVSAVSSDSEYGVQGTPNERSGSCTPSSSGSSTLGYSANRRRISKVKAKLLRSRYFLVIEERNRLRKLAARKIKLAANTVSALTLLRWEEKIDRKYEKKFEEQRMKLQRLRKDNELLRAKTAVFREGCSVLENSAMVLQVRLEEKLDPFTHQSSDDFYSPYS